MRSKAMSKSERDFTVLAGFIVLALLLGSARAQTSGSPTDLTTPLELHRSGFTANQVFAEVATHNELRVGFAWLYRLEDSSSARLERKGTP